MKTKLSLLAILAAAGAILGLARHPRLTVLGLLWLGFTWAFAAGYPNAAIERYYLVPLLVLVRTALEEGLGPLLEAHPRFPNHVNVGFMEIIDRNRIRLRVFERGAGETLACGSGACAAVVAGRVQGLLDDKVTTELRGGDLVVSWQGDDHPVLMTGPATFVFEGKIEL